MTTDDRQPAPREIVVISGKGGTGKTSLTASLAVLADHPVIADCDVDAADLHLLLNPRVRERHDFYGGSVASIRQRDCVGCGDCLADCRFNAIGSNGSPGGNPALAVDPLACEGCGVCVRFCPAQAIDFTDRLCGEWMVSDTRCGPMVHARLGVAAENSGKLVSIVRQEAVRIAKAEGNALVLVDGPPGIGCPVIASVTGASQALVVTEPTVSGEHDLARALSLVRHFGIPAAVCVNKWDLNPQITERIENASMMSMARLVGRVRYDPGVSKAQTQAQTVVETDTPVAHDIRQVYDNLGIQE